MIKKINFVLLLGLVVGGIFCTYVTYYSESSGSSAFLAIVYLISFFVSAALFFLLKEKMGLWTVVLTLTLTVPNQLLNLYKLNKFEIEAEKVVIALKNLQQRNLPLPSTREELPIESKDFLPQIQSYKHEDKEIELCYFISSPSTSYCYFSDRGWIYQDD
jgi:hypothetical protein